MSSRLLREAKAAAGKAGISSPHRLGTFVQKQHARFLLSCRQSRRQSGIARADHDHVVNLFCHTYSTSSLTLAVTGINLKGS